MDADRKGDPWGGGTEERSAATGHRRGRGAGAGLHHAVAVSLGRPPAWGLWRGITGWTKSGHGIWNACWDGDITSREMGGGDDHKPITQTAHSQKNL